MKSSILPVNCWHSDPILLLAAVARGMLLAPSQPRCRNSSKKFRQTLHRCRNSSKKFRHETRHQTNIWKAGVNINFKSVCGPVLILFFAHCLAGKSGAFNLRLLTDIDRGTLWYREEKRMQRSIEHCCFDTLRCTQTCQLIRIKKLS